MKYLRSQVYHIGKYFQYCQTAGEDLFREERWKIFNVISEK